METIYKRLGLLGPLKKEVSRWAKGKTKYAVSKNNFIITQIKYNGNSQ